MTVLMPTTMPIPMPAFPKSRDPFSGFLDQLKTDGSLYCRSTLRGPWALDLPAMADKMMFHIVTAGECYLQLSGGKPLRLKQGSLALVPHGRGHLLSSDPAIPPVPFFESGVQQLSERFEVLDIPGDGPLTELTCGVLSFDGVMGNHLIKQLPDTLVLEPTDYSQQQWLVASLAFIASEAQTLRPGSETIITHLADIMVIQVIRHWLDSAPQASEGWFAALRDKQIGKALHVIHARPDKKWTVSSLAQECGMSRSNFSARFSDLVGNSVKNYLVEWRMKLAYHTLKNQRLPLLQLAQATGYDSEAAFSRAFKRVIGVAPSQVGNAV